MNFSFHNLTIALLYECVITVSIINTLIAFMKGVLGYCTITFICTVTVSIGFSQYANKSAKVGNRNV